MNISNETKVGSLTAIAIVLLILGFNFLKGKSLTAKTFRYYAVFDNIQGLVSSNAVIINGKQIGTVSGTSAGNDMRRITVAMTLNQPVIIPVNSYASISTSILGLTTLEIKLGDSSKAFNPGDTILSRSGSGMFDAALQKVDPVLFQVKNAVHSLDSVLATVNSVFDPNTKNNIRSVIENLNKTTASLTVSSASLQTLLNTQTGALAGTLNNVNSFTGNLKDNNDKLTKIMTNVSNLDLEKTLTNLNGTVSELKTTIGKLNSDNGTMGLLMNDKKLYNNLNATSNKLNLLLDDLRVHPKRYINISVFGKKDKNGPLTTPLPDTINAPYTK